MMLLLVGTAPAADLRADDVVTIDASDVVDDDLFVAGREVRIAGRVNGDVLVFAEHVEVSGSVGGDLLAVARTLTITGRVEDDVRSMGQDLRVTPDAVVAGDLVGAGFGLLVAPGGHIGRDLVFAGHSLLHRGSAGRDLRYAGTTLQVTGAVGRDVDAVLAYSETSTPTLPLATAPFDAVERGLELTASAEVGRDLDYRSPERGRVAGNVEGIHRYAPAPFVEVDNAAGRGLAVVRRGLGLLLVGLAMLATLPIETARLVQAVREQPLRHVGRGLSTLLGAVAAGLIVAVATVLAAGLVGLVTLGGLAGVTLLVGLVTEGALVAGLVVIVGFVAPIPGLLWAGEALWERLTRRPLPGRGWLLVAGLVPYAVLLSIPVVGLVAQAVVTLAGLGALASLWLLPLSPLKAT